MPIEQGLEIRQFYWIGNAVQEEQLEYISRNLCVLENKSRVCLSLRIGVQEGQVVSEYAAHSNGSRAAWQRARAR